MRPMRTCAACRADCGAGAVLAQRVAVEVEVDEAGLGQGERGEEEERNDEKGDLAPHLVRRASRRETGGLW